MPSPAPPLSALDPRAPRTGVLLVNTGSPRSPAVADVRAYLRQFLSDPRVLDMPALGRWLLLNLVILPFRPAKSAEAYRAIWTERGSPLLAHGQDLASRLEAALDGATVRQAMQFGSPSIPDEMARLAREGVDRIVVVPMFPQYAAASTGSAIEAVLREAAKHWVVPALHVVPPFWHEPEFLDAVASNLREAMAREAPDHVVLSYHGLPERHVRKTDPSGHRCLQRPDCCAALDDANRHCYRAQCFATSRRLIDRLGLDPAQVTTCFQSRLGRTPWIQPHTDVVLTDLARRGVRKVVVSEPSFVADCLETLEEIGIRGREDFKAAGGQELVLVPAPNAAEAWARGLAGILARGCGWVRVRDRSERDPPV